MYTEGMSCCWEVNLRARSWEVSSPDKPPCSYRRSGGPASNMEVVPSLLRFPQIKPSKQVWTTEDMSFISHLTEHNWWLPAARPISRHQAHTFNMHTNKLIILSTQTNNANRPPCKETWTQGGALTPTHITQLWPRVKHNSFCTLTLPLSSTPPGTPVAINNKWSWNKYHDLFLEWRCLRMFKHVSGQPILAYSGIKGGISHWGLMLFLQ